MKITISGGDVHEVLAIMRARITDATHDMNALSPDDYRDEGDYELCVMPYVAYLARITKLYMDMIELAEAEDTNDLV